MKKLLTIPFLFVLSLGFVSCLNNDDDDPIYYFYDEPALVESLSGNQTVIKTAYGKFFVSEAESSRLEKGDLLWTSFTVDMKNQPSKDTLTAIHFRYDNIDSTEVTIPANKEEFESHLTDIYSDPFDLAVLYKTYIDSLLFFNFTQKEVVNQTREYELVLNPEIENSNNFPTLYIRTKTTEISSTGNLSNKGKEETVFAFDMTKFIDYYRENISKTTPITFNLKYKIGEDKEGKDIYREFKSNPIPWNLK